MLQRYWLRGLLAFLLITLGTTTAFFSLHKLGTKAASNVSFKETIGSDTYTITEQSAGSFDGNSTITLGTWDISDNGTDQGTISGTLTGTANGSTKDGAGNDIPNGSGKLSLTGTGSLADYASQLSQPYTLNPSDPDYTSNSAYTSATNSGYSVQGSYRDMAGDGLQDLCKSGGSCIGFGETSKGVFPLGPYSSPDYEAMYDGENTVENAAGYVVNAANDLNKAAATATPTASPTPTASRPSHIGGEPLLARNPHIVPLLARNPHIAPLLGAALLFIGGIASAVGGALVLKYCAIISSTKGCLGIPSVAWAIVGGVLIAAGAAMLVGAGIVSGQAALNAVVGSGEATTAITATAETTEGIEMAQTVGTFAASDAGDAAATGTAGWANTGSVDAWVNALPESFNSAESMTISLPSPR